MGRFVSVEEAVIMVITGNAIGIIAEVTAFIAAHMERDIFWVINTMESHIDRIGTKGVQFFINYIK